VNKGLGWAVIGSFGGNPRHPQWWLNLKANPKFVVQIKSTKIPIRAREAFGEERNQLWLEFFSMYPGYMGYEQRTDRRFPIAVLEPI
jgi:deazaflavin-dependent oxidoreductase (nitroreductase family)